ncbi:hypothetical protein G7Y89_g13615 [Cudoniella acicularis]|uniref:DUF676 domain-containing protein n=1 Tax=Cudoniella acicularis TaxID=354080 RepID=A0A8H4R875_9HELO|nr:hypothetical protein G7Y89_g13615 [Cudoniella acicularis]
MSRVDSPNAAAGKSERKPKPTGTWASFSSMLRIPTRSSISNSQPLNHESGALQLSRRRNEVPNTSTNDSTALSRISHEGYRSPTSQSTIDSGSETARLEEEDRHLKDKVAKNGALIDLYNPHEDLPMEETYPVDIIALHGINGGAKKTWTHENGSLWLRDFVPSAFPGARIYTYAYNANVFFSLATGNIDTFAEDLLEEMMNKRTTTEALAKAKLDSGRYGNLLASTSAIFFMATPHRGSETTPLPEVVATLINLPLKGSGIARFAGKARPDLIKPLQKDGDALTKYMKDFRPLTDGKIKFFSFIEDNITIGLTKRVVDDRSASLDSPFEVCIHMDANHQTIVRYESKTDPNYEKVLAKLREAVQDATNPCLKAIAAEDSGKLSQYNHY